MNVTRKEQRIIQRALNAWQASGELTPSDSQRLAHTLRVSPFDWRRLSRYAFWTALACVLIALGSLFADSELVAWLLSLFSHSALTRILLPALLAVACYGWGFSPPAAGDAVALQHRGDFVSGRRLYRVGAMAVG
ncbi:membrane protein [Klebsiella quasipneumoniae]|nr:membrane protein [Klebsiella quasipneumoniae]